MLFVRDRAMLQAARHHRCQQRPTVRDRQGDWLFRIDVLAGRDSFFERGLALMGGGGIEQHSVGRIGQCPIEIGGPRHAAVLPRNASETFLVASDQDQLRHDAVLAHRKAAFGTNRRERIFQMLSGCNAASCAMYNDAYGERGHLDFR